MENVTININNASQAEAGMLSDVLAMVPRQLAGDSNVMTVTIDVQRRMPADAPPYKHPGWVEYGVTFRHTDSKPFFIMAIQRELGAKTEFHS